MFVVLTLLIGILLAIRYSYRRRWSLGTRTPLPPGPRPLPIIGNIFDLPLTNTWRKLADLSRRYGNILYFSILGRPVIVLGSIQPALGLLDRKSVNCSGRPSTVIMKLLGVDVLFVVMPYGRQWREHRRAFHRSFSMDQVARHEPVQLNSARRFLGRLLESPGSLPKHLNKLVSDLAMRTIYGIDMDAQQSDTELYDAVEQLRSFVDLVVLPPGHLMELFPVLRHLPIWLPGMRIKRTALEGRRVFHATLEALDRKAFSTFNSAQGKLKDCLVSRILHHERSEATMEVRKMSQHVAASAYLAGSDTTHALLEALFLAMAMHPEVQKRAQEELDAVIGPIRLPEFSDRDRLPYTRAILKEVMRWHAIVPMGVPHQTTNDDEYDGFFIPGGTVINTNIWAMSRDPEEYPDPESFKPERFVGVKSRRTTSSGSGEGRGPREHAAVNIQLNPSVRRICPGRHFSTALAFIHFASVFHVSDIQHPAGDDGTPVKLEYRPTDGLVSHIHGYQYTIKPRSPQAERLVSEHPQAA